MRKCSSMVWNPASSSAKRSAPDEDHQRQADRRVDGVAAAHPLPEAEHVGRVDAEVRRPPSAFVLTATKCRATAASPSASTSQARAVWAFDERLHRRERLRRHDEQRRGGVEPGELAGDVGPVDVGHEAGGELGVAERIERPVRHRRPEVAAADADVDDRADAPAGRTGPVAVADAIAELAHPGQHLVHVGHDVVAVDLDHGVRGRPQRDVEDGALLGDVDRLAGEHRVAARLDAGGRGNGLEGGEDVVVDALLAVVDAEIADLQQVALGAPGSAANSSRRCGGRGTSSRSAHAPVVARSTPSRAGPSRPSGPSRPFDGAR